MSRTILIDADILAYQIASSQEQVFEFEGEHVLHADLNKGKAEVDNALGYILEKTDGDDAEFFLSDDDANFRKEVLPSYKESRGSIRKPMILKGLKKYMIDECNGRVEPRLEADDLIGISATEPHKGERVIFSADKDLKTVPGLHWSPDDGQVIEIGPEEAHKAFLRQVLTGDTVDNFDGCPGVGLVTANQFLDQPYKWVPQERELKSGPRKGQTEVRWVKEPTDEIWEGVVSHYRKAWVAKPKKAAITQARCAFILRHGYFNFATKEVTLWKP